MIRRRQFLDWQIARLRAEEYRRHRIMVTVQIHLEDKTSEDPCATWTKIYDV